MSSPRAGWRWPVPERIRPTKVGVWYVVSALVVGVAATNTGNNALYIVMAVMLGLLVVSGLSSRVNLRGLAFELAPPGEVFANRPFHVRLTVRNGGRLLPRWLLVFTLGERGQPLLVPYLPRRGASRGFMEICRAAAATASRRCTPAASSRSASSTRGCATAPTPRCSSSPSCTRRRRWRPSGPRRGATATRSASAGGTPCTRCAPSATATTRGASTGSRRRAPAPWSTPSATRRRGGGCPSSSTTRDQQARFERLVSEAATAAVDYLARGYEVELVTRDERLPFAGGPLQRRSILESLALVQPAPLAERPLLGALDAPQLRLAMEPAGAGPSRREPAA
jgi:hypothetical protein